MKSSDRTCKCIKTIITIFLDFFCYASNLKVGKRPQMGTKKMFVRARISSTFLKEVSAQLVLKQLEFQFTHSKQKTME